MKHITSLFVLSISLFLLGCGGSSSEFENNSEINNPNTVAGLQSKFVLNDNLLQEVTAFLQGENVQFVLSLTNNSNVNIVLEFNSGQRYDIYLRDDTDTEVWRWSSTRLFTQDLADVIIPVGETIEYRENWDQTLSNGTRSPTGRYSAHGFILDQEESFVKITIQ